MNTNFSRHAYERVLERLSMDLDEVASLLDWDLTIKIGEENGTRRIHRLFFSREDRQCFIAIQDEKTKTIVTILPVDYYETLAAKIPPSLLKEAEEMVSRPPPPPPNGAGPAPSKAPEEPPVNRSFKLSGTFMNRNGKPRSFNLGSWPEASYKGSIARLLQEPRFFPEIQIRAKAKKRDEDEYLVGIMIRLRKKDEVVWVNVEDNGLELTCQTAGQENQ